jgi:hypothetical protein
LKTGGEPSWELELEEASHLSQGRLLITCSWENWRQGLSLGVSSAQGRGLAFERTRWRKFSEHKDGQVREAEIKAEIAQTLDR